MNGLAADAEAFASVLAFLDDQDVSELSSTDGAPDPPAAPAKRRNGGRSGSRNPAGYTTDRLRRKRAELAALRDEAAELEHQLTQLQQLRADDDRVDNRSMVGRRHLQPEAKRWLQEAEIERQRRRQAEHVNRKLRALLAHETELHVAIGRAIRNHRRVPEAAAMLRSELLGDSFVYPPDPDRYSAVFNEAHIPDAEIQARLAQLEQDTDWVLGPPAICGADLVSCSMQKRTDPVVGEFTEIRSTTTTDHCSVARAASVFWKPLNPPKTAWMYFYDKRATSHVHKSVLTIQRRRRDRSEPVHLNVQHHARKVESADRSIVVLLALVRPPVPGVTLREDFWTRITKGDHGQVVVETCYRIYRLKDTETATPEAADVGAFVTSALVQMTHRNMLATQNWLLSGCSDLVQYALDC